MKTAVKGIVTVLLAGTVAVSMCACGDTDENQDLSAAATQLSVWGTYASAKVMQDPALNSNNAHFAPNLEVYSARGEAESGQIIITAGEKDVKEYTVAVSDLTCGENVYKTENVEVFFQHYVNVEKKSWNETENADYFPVGWTPDALIPQEISVKFKENSVAAGKNQGITFDFSVPATQPAGTYTGEFSLNIDGKEHKIPVSLHVWDFDISETNGMNLWDIVDGGRYINGELTSNFDELYYKYYDALLKYKLNAYHFFDYGGTEMNAELAVNWVTALKKYWQNPAFGGVFLPDIGNEREKVQTLFTEIAKACVEDETNYFSKIRFYHQREDEPQYFEGMIDQCVTKVKITTQVLHDFAEYELGKIEGFSALSADLQEEIRVSVVDMPQVVTTYYAASEELQEVVNAYCPQIQNFETMHDRRLYTANREEKNGETWMYTCVEPIYPYPTYHIDDYLLGGRILKWMQKEYDIDAYLNWSVCMYAGHKGDGTKDLYPIDPYTNPIRHNPDNMKFANGDGYLFYPMAKYGADTPIPSMRLLSARDGQEDYDTLCALEKAYATGKTTYSVSGDPLKNLSDTLQSFYSRLYSGVYANNDDKNFNTVRLALGGLTDVACDESQTMILQSDVQRGKGVSLTIYSKADEVYIDGNKLEKDGNRFIYARTLADGENSVTVKIVKGDTVKAFPYLLPSKNNSFDTASLTSDSIQCSTGSLATVSNGELSLKAVSSGSSVGEQLTFHPFISVEMGLDFKNVAELGFTLRNTCGQDVKIDLYLTDGVNEVKADSILLYAYEKYDYRVRGIAERIKNFGTVTGIELRFENVDANLNLLSDRTLKVYDFTYSTNR